ncbi:DUF4846 domain-containing protein [Hymenobacter sp. CRA2]|uniref:DUF4846 domain-containing protein n=1 Tax=Hymenobacter sp. CRA2 TaxID=1955620 RepID=UPI00098F4FF8|nr:DUF4846 domain-containing protein [Hymenobacter sp. CRA2]OON70260.1 hypothetical protein B0919_05870 [Hymenobacter sp. CRA2]
MNYLLFFGLAAGGSLVSLASATSPLPRPSAEVTADQPAAAPDTYAWLTHAYRPDASLASRFAPPAGCQRVSAAAGSFGHWLRYLPLRPKGTAVRLHNGQLKQPQSVHAAVLDIDTGTRDLQQCADAVMRLRAEYLFGQNFRRIHFHLTSGYDAWFGDWVDGQGFRLAGETVEASKRPAEAPTHTALRRYLDQVFTFAGTLSLSRELRPVPLAEAQPGDVFIKGGAPGHAVIILDVAQHPASGARYALLAQSYMPAQDMHVLRNTTEPQLGAWFRLTAPDGIFATPEWDFEATQLKRW